MNFNWNPAVSRPCLAGWLEGQQRDAGKSKGWTEASRTGCRTAHRGRAPTDFGNLGDSTSETEGARAHVTIRTAGMVKPFRARPCHA